MPYKNKIANLSLIKAYVLILTRVDISSRISLLEIKINNFLTNRKLDISTKNGQQFSR